MGNILIKAYDELGRELCVGYAEDEKDLERAKAWLQKKCNAANLVVEKEIIKNPTPEDEKEIDDLLTSVAENVATVKTYKALEEIYDLYDAGEISGTEARHRIEALYAGDEDRIDEAIRNLYQRDCDCYDNYDEDEECEDDCECNCEKHSECCNSVEGQCPRN